MTYRNHLFAALLLVLTSIWAFRSRYLAEQQPYEVAASPAKYQWAQLLQFGHGTHQYEWKPGTFPMGLKPIQAFGGKLWMVGQKAAWSSSDGITWVQHPKQDWGERITMTYAYFDHTLG